MAKELIPCVLSRQYRSRKDGKYTRLLFVTTIGRIFLYSIGSFTLRNFTILYEYIHVYNMYIYTYLDGVHICTSVCVYIYGVYIILYMAYMHIEIVGIWCIYMHHMHSIFIFKIYILNFYINYMRVYFLAYWYIRKNWM